MNAKAPFWSRVSGGELRQGDFLPDCVIPVFRLRDGTAELDEVVSLERGNLVVVTQSCDLENNKVDFVALCPICTLSEFAGTNKQFKDASAREDVRKGRREGLHMLGPTDATADNSHALIVDFRMIYSLPFAYLSQHARGIEHRWRLESPFLEHFSQAFARFFMRVGLPSTIEPFKK